ncbi:Trihelix transcription factor GT-2 [Apostasia shenzhenica]|uniref:Trihelix transcription factor GT-2 n=1 Tax=Apostasia shenzhenica TaxID=1088818 RepID=A0A2I0A3U0_9ASPA|nr:Trihelix transcription factor GT-2 [Apostasia shenzhenica]
MQHGGGSPFGGPPPQELAPSFPGAPEAAAPISMRPPPASGFDDMGQQAAEEEQGMAAGEGSGAPGNRWPRQETVALLKIRSDMDAAFRDATLKGPLWEEVSRKLGELGYRRSAKKCKEKFENVHKYYKRTKEGRAGRQDGKSYRFFSQLEALNSSASSATVTVAAGNPPLPVMASAGAATPFIISGTPGTSSRPQLLPFPTAGPTATPQLAAPAPPPMAAPGLSFSSNTSSYTGTESDDEEVGEAGGGSRKRKREGGHGGGEAAKGSRKMMEFFERLMQQVMERQEAMQQRFLEAIERREQDRMIREEAWRRQEMSRISREHELAAQERAAAASRDAAIINFLQKLTGQTISFPAPPPPPPSPPIPAAAATAPIKSQSLPPPPPPPQPTPPASSEMVAIAPEPPPQAQLPLETSSSSRWPKAEVHALIKLRSAMEGQYQESGPKGPLWEEISSGMKRLGYSRSSKRCKEKWENINKYFKKVKESNKKRPEDAKTCPYFHQLDALYRSKLHSSYRSVAAAATSSHDLPEPEPELNSQPPQPPPGLKNNETGGPTGSSTKKPAEDIVKDLMEQPLMDSLDDDNVAGGDDELDEDDEEQEEEDGDMQFKIQFQRPRIGGSGGGGGPAGEGNFLAMVRSSSSSSSSSLLPYIDLLWNNNEMGPAGGGVAEEISHPTAESPEFGQGFFVFLLGRLLLHRERCLWAL